MENENQHEELKALRALLQSKDIEITKLKLDLAEATRPKETTQHFEGEF